MEVGAVLGSPSPNPQSHRQRPMENRQGAGHEHGERVGFPSRQTLGSCGAARNPEVIGSSSMEKPLKKTGKKHKRLENSAGDR